MTMAREAVGIVKREKLQKQLDESTSLPPRLKQAILAVSQKNDEQHGRISA